MDQIFGVKQSKFEVQRCHRVTRVTLCKKNEQSVWPGLGTTVENTQKMIDLVKNYD